MQSFKLNLLFLAATAALSTGATAQKTYKCGDSYSQTPCPGAAQIETADPRTSAQKKQTDTAASRDAKSAETLQKTRLQQEAKDLAANSSAATLAAPAPEAANGARPSQLKKNKKTPEFFTAQAPGEKKKKKVAKKIVVKKVESQP